MAKEIERKFLVAHDGWKKSVMSATRMRQGYISDNEDRSVRVRTCDGKTARLTIKIGKSALIRDEYEYDIPLDDAEEMMGMALGNVIEKVRHRVTVGQHVWEIDVFGGSLEGLVVAEVELGSEHEVPRLPDWAGREVTGDRRYSNHALATDRPRPERVYALSN